MLFTFKSLLLFPRQEKFRLISPKTKKASITHLRSRGFFLNQHSPGSISIQKKVINKCMNCNMKQKNPSERWIFYRKKKINSNLLLQNLLVHFFRLFKIRFKFYQLNKIVYQRAERFIVEVHNFHVLGAERYAVFINRRFFLCTTVGFDNKQNFHTICTATARPLANMPVSFQNVHTSFFVMRQIIFIGRFHIGAVVKWFNIPLFTPIAS
jgi:hypothetical protein